MSQVMLVVGSHACMQRVIYLTSLLPRKLLCLLAQVGLWHLIEGLQQKALGAQRGLDGTRVVHQLLQSLAIHVCPARQVGELFLSLFLCVNNLFLAKECLMQLSVLVNGDLSKPRVSDRLHSLEPSERLRLPLKILFVDLLF